MEAKYYATALWPGLAELWWRGRLSALPAAMAFALAVNLLLITRYLYPGWMSGGLVTIAFWIGMVTWLVFAVRSIREIPELIAPRAVSDQPDRFPEARGAYLRGEWNEAEGLLTDVLAIEPRDPPALLLLTGVYRHTDRLEAAEILLNEIIKLEVADGWQLEAQAESRRLQRAMEGSQSDPAAPDHGETDSDSPADLASSTGTI